MAYLKAHPEIDVNSQITKTQKEFVHLALTDKFFGTHPQITGSSAEYADKLRNILNQFIYKQFDNPKAWGTYLTYFNFSAIVGNLGAVIYCLKRNGNLHQVKGCVRDSHYSYLPPINAAAWGGSIAVLRILLYVGADVNTLYYQASAFQNALGASMHLHFKLNAIYDDILSAILLINSGADAREKTHPAQSEYGIYKFPFTHEEIPEKDRLLPTKRIIPFLNEQRNKISAEDALIIFQKKGILTDYTVATLQKEVAEDAILQQYLYLTEPVKPFYKMAAPYALSSYPGDLSYRSLPALPASEIKPDLSDIQSQSYSKPQAVVFEKKEEFDTKSEPDVELKEELDNKSDSDVEASAKPTSPPAGWDSGSEDDSDDLKKTELADAVPLSKLIIPRSFWHRKKIPDEKGQLKYKRLDQASMWETRKVFAGEYWHKDHKEDVAIKSIKITTGAEDTFRLFCQEIKPLYRLTASGAKRVVALKGITLHHNENECHGSMLSNPADYNLQEYLKLNKGKLSREQQLHLLSDIAKGLKETHEAGIVHQDIKDSNILLFWDKTKKRYVAKISDLGVARIKADLTESYLTRHGKSISSSSRSAVGTAVWQAPETVVKNIHERHTDIFSFALVAWRILANGEDLFVDDEILFDQEGNFVIKRLPASSETLHNIYKQEAFFDYRPACPQYIEKSDSLWQLIQACWRPMYNLKVVKRAKTIYKISRVDYYRPTASEIVDYLKRLKLFYLKGLEHFQQPSFDHLQDENIYKLRDVLDKLSKKLESDEPLRTMKLIIEEKLGNIQDKQLTAEEINSLVRKAISPLFDRLTKLDKTSVRSFYVDKFLILLTCLQLSILIADMDKGLME